MKKIIIFLMCAILMCGCGGAYDNNEEKTNAENVIVLSEDKAVYNGNTVSESDYTWHLDTETGEEYFTGEEPKDADVYIAHDIVYYPEFSENDFVKEEYDGEQEWVNHYKTDDLKDYILTTLPALSDSIPTEMMHSESDAYANPVLHITKAGTYELKGNWHGQIYIDLGDDAFTDENANVTLFLNGVDVACDVAPALIFKNVFESDNAWEERSEYTSTVDIADAGAKVVICDGTENNFSGANVFRILKPEYKKEGSSVQKKRYKMDGAFYSFESLLISGEKNGTGILNITGTTFEGLDSELHLTIDSGYINIVSQDDGINVNEDDVSVFTMNGGRLTVFAAQGAEGDVIDSNGYIKVNGGMILGTTPSMADDILDSEKPAEVSDNAIVISSTAGNNMPGHRPDNMEPGEKPEGFPGERPDGEAGLTPPEKQGDVPPEKPGDIPPEAPTEK